MDSRVRRRAGPQRSLSRRRTIARRVWRRSVQPYPRKGRGRVRNLPLLAPQHASGCDMVSGAMKSGSKKKAEAQVKSPAPAEQAASLSSIQVVPGMSDLPLYVGTSGWSYTIWKPAFYPQDIASKNFLKFYATQLTAVEVNYTFRSRLSEKAATGWMADVGPNFRFALKANQYITHIRRLQNAEEPLQRFLPTLQPLATQLGPVLFQLPPNLKADVALLRDFLALLPRSFKAAFEFRHESWFTDEVYRALQERNAALCIAETEKLSTPEVRNAKRRVALLQGSIDL